MRTIPRETLEDIVRAVLEYDKACGGCDNPDVSMTCRQATDRDEMLCPWCALDAALERSGLRGRDASTPHCPGPDCMTCSGEACDLCGYPPRRDGPRCEHDVSQRHAYQRREPFHASLVDHRKVELK